MPAYLGQHFLKDEGVVRRIVEASTIGPGDVVVEIGPGRGILTRPLLEKAGKLIAVELDQDLIAKLRQELPASEKFEIVHCDFLEWKLDAALAPYPAIKFVGNLPYGVASPILQKVLAWERWSTAVFMFQKEVCERLIAVPGTKAYGVLTLSAALHAEIDWVADAGRLLFRPPPKVDSAVLRFRRRDAVLPENVTRESFMKVVKAAFSQRRKQVVTPLAEGLGLEKPAVRNALETCGIKPTSRAEEIPFYGFAALARALAPQQA